MGGVQEVPVSSVWAGNGDLPGESISVWRAKDQVAEDLTRRKRKQESQFQYILVVDIAST